MTAGRRPPPGISVIEQMAAVHHEKSRSIIHWHQLSKDDRLRKMDAMEAAVEIIPDRLGQAYAENGISYESYRQAVARGVHCTELSRRPMTRHNTTVDAYVSEWIERQAAELPPVIAGIATNVRVLRPVCEMG